MSTLDVPSAIAVVSAVSNWLSDFASSAAYDTCSICGKTHCTHLGGDGTKDSIDSLFGQMYAAALPEYFNKFAYPSLVIIPESKILKCPPLVTYS